MDMKPNNEPNIFEYNNFWHFLRDLYTFKHTGNPHFTKSYICKKLGLPNSRSYFQDVLNGKYVSSIKIPLFIKLFKLAKEEGLYFRVLVKYNQCVDDPEEKEMLLEQLISLNRTPKEIITKDAYAYYKEWYHSVIRALLSTFNFKNNYKTLARMVFPPISLKQAKESIVLLKKLGLINKDPDGYLKPTSKVISTGPLIKDDIIKQYQLKCVDNAKKTIMINQAHPQRIITKMISISHEAYKQIEKRVEKFNAEITSMVHKDELPPDRVYQLDVFLFPQSQRENVTVHSPSVMIV